MGQQLRLIETFGLSDNVAKARDKFGAINLNHSVSKKWTIWFCGIIYLQSVYY
jgi:hypothetical protein